ncbi:MAG: nucleotidyl transferase AbiEii/AbiGii toxin family protein [Bacteroidia bacterium]
MNIHEDAVSKPLMNLLQKLMQIESLRNFNLVGGTALALQLGHRKSIDIHLFGIGKNDLQGIQVDLSENYNATIKSASEIMFASYFDDIKVDAVNYPYQILKPLVVFNEIRMYDLEDIAAMKLSAISQRGSKKDFWDIYFLLEKFSMNEMLDFFKMNFKVTDVSHALRSLSYFKDADNEADPEKIIPVKWNDIKKNLQMNYLK